MAKLPKRIREVLLKMRDSTDYYDAEIVEDGKSIWLGDDIIHRKTLNYLLNNLCISDTSDTKIHRYVINGTGKAVLDDDTVLDRIKSALKNGIPVDHKGYPLKSH